MNFLQFEIGHLLFLLEIINQAYVALNVIIILLCGLNTL